jgi:putative heme-binding domain-containing protein
MNFLPRIFLALFSLAFIGVTLATEPPKRIPWTTSHIHGSPEPPKPCVAVRAYPGLEFKEALELVFEPQTKRWFALERAGRIVSWPQIGQADHADLVADLKTLHPDVDNLYGLAFHPKFAENHQVFITYTRGSGFDDGTKLSRFEMKGLALDPASEKVILTWRSGGHNGANLQFGPDGMLYISTGDSEVPSPPDPLSTGQDISDLLSSILRIDVDRVDSGLAYAIPKDNPFVGKTVEGADHKQKPARGEVWAFGLRNPWKMSFDRATGRLWCGDVGWELWEMIHLIQRGGNYGWSAMEASQTVKPETKSSLAPISPPIVAHSHDEAASITGGFVYHGKNLPELEGAYIYGDWVTGKVWALWHDGKQVTRHEEIADTHHKIIAFGQDADGELLYLDYSSKGALYELQRNEAQPTEKFPTKLSETGLFKGEVWGEYAPGIYDFYINETMWADHMVKVWHSIALPGLETIRTKVKKQKNKDGSMTSSYELVWPKDSVLVRTILSPEMLGVGPIETQILHFDGVAWAAYTYRSNATGTDSDLVPSEGASEVFPIKNPSPSYPNQKEYSWHYSSRAECIRCHNSWNGTSLAFRPGQLRHGISSGIYNDGNLLEALAAMKFVDGEFLEQDSKALTPRWADKGSLEGKARTYLHVNCAHCHRENAGGAVTMMLNLELAEEQMRAVGIIPQQGGLGLKNPKLIDPGNPWNSVICVRMATPGSGHMPIVGSPVVDVEGLAIVEDWIASMKPGVKSAADLISNDWTDEALKARLATVEGGLEVLRAVDARIVDDTLRQKAIDLALASPQPTVRDLFDRFLPDEKRVKTLGLNPDVKQILALKGDANRGGQLLAIQGKLATCFACHFINGNGRDFGPDLSKVGSRLTRAQILESLAMPSKVIAPGFAAVVVELKGGGAQTGFIVKETADEISLKTATGQTLALKRADIAKQTQLPASLMPEGLLQSLTAQEAADVLNYMETLR